MIEAFFKSLEGPKRPLFWLHGTVDGPVEAVDSSRFLHEARRWAWRLRQSPEPVVGILGRMTFSMTAAWFGAILAGRLPVFLSHPSRKITPEEYARKLANYRERFGGCVMVGEAVDRGVCPELLSDADLRLDPVPEVVPWPSWTPDRPLFLQCSSGTTGLQKAVAITSAMLTAQVQAHAQALKLDPRHDRMVSWLPLYHDMGLAGVFLPALLTGTPLHLLDTFEWSANPAWLLAVIERQRGTLCWLPNFAFSWLARVGGCFDLGAMRAFINCSEPVSSGAFDRFVAAFGVKGEQLAVCYALAENVFAATLTPLGAPPGVLVLDRAALARRQVQVRGRGVAGGGVANDQPETHTVVFGCGASLPGVSIRIVCRSEEEQVGEILLAGGGAVGGYHGQPPLREDGWFPTGDLGFVRDGELYVTGRIKDLIIQNGKNIHPADLEEALGRFPEVQPGRVVALGRMDAEVDSERIVVLCEPAQDLTPEAQRQLRIRLQQALDSWFDIRSEVDCVPRHWLKKTSSGKLARLENLRRYESALNTEIQLIGDSHVRIFWSGPTSHHNRYRRIHAHWLGLIWSENWQQTLPFFSNLVGRMGPTDVLILACGEPECRSIFPQDPDPEARILRSVGAYRECLTVLRRLWSGRMAFMTGIPTHPLNIDNGDAQWPIRGTPEVRYHWQALFYRRMRALCTELVIHFIDVCTPLLGADGRMDPSLLCDKAHLDPVHEGVILKAIQERFGHLDLSANDPAPEDRLWDGSYDHYVALMRLKVRSFYPMIEESDWSKLISGGVLDSLSLVALIAMLNRTFRFQLDPATLRREDFESIDRIWERFGP
ncbi:MAG: AMP-binding protein [Magnetococcales bacterium]|nr:AMP-binding protein [Magnetococcales bacterium]